MVGQSRGESGREERGHGDDGGDGKLSCPLIASLFLWKQSLSEDLFSSFLLQW